MSEYGWFYGTAIDPVLKPMRKYVVQEIKPDETVIDVACGTGDQAIKLSSIVKSITGVDYSLSMIEYAKRKSKKCNATNINFVLGDATNLNAFHDKSFDTAIMTLALHQFQPQLHSPILREMKRVASKIIIVDYAVPFPKNYVGLGIKIVEFLAGIEHNKNFKRYCRLGGLKKILPQNYLSIDKSVLLGKGAFQLVVCSVKK